MKLLETFGPIHLKTRGINCVAQSVKNRSSLFFCFSCKSYFVMSKSKKFLKKHYETLKLNIRRIKKNNFKQNCDILFEFNPLGI